MGPAGRGVYRVWDEAHVHAQRWDSEGRRGPLSPGSQQAWSILYEDVSAGQAFTRSLIPAPPRRGWE